MTWTNLTFSYGAVLTSTQMTQLYNNFNAMGEGQSGAPKITAAALQVGALKVKGPLANHLSNGTLGSVTLSANTTMNPGMYQFTNLVVNSGVTLACNGTPFIIFCTSTFHVASNATIKVAEVSRYDVSSTAGSGNFMPFIGGATYNTASVFINNFLPLHGGWQATSNFVDTWPFLSLPGWYKGGMPGINVSSGLGGGVFVAVAEVWRGEGWINAQGGTHYGGVGARTGGGGGAVFIHASSFYADTASYSVNAGSIDSGASSAYPGWAKRFSVSA